MAAGLERSQAEGLGQRWASGVELRAKYVSISLVEPSNRTWPVAPTRVASAIRTSRSGPSPRMVSRNLDGRWASDCMARWWCFRCKEARWSPACIGRRVASARPAAQAQVLWVDATPSLKAVRRASAIRFCCRCSVPGRDARVAGCQTVRPCCGHRQGERIPMAARVVRRAERTGCAERGGPGPAGLSVAAGTAVGRATSGPSRRGGRHHLAVALEGERLKGRKHSGPHSK